MDELFKLYNSFNDQRKQNDNNPFTSIEYIKIILIIVHLPSMNTE